MLIFSGHGKASANTILYSDDWQKFKSLTFSSIGNDKDQ